MKLSVILVINPSVLSYGLMIEVMQINRALSGQEITLSRAHLAIILLAALRFPTGVVAHGGGHSGGHSHSGTHSSSQHGGHSGTHSSSKKHKSSSSSHVGNGKHGGSKKAVGVKRDKKGKIGRSSAAKEKFMKQTGYPHGRPGYVVDHIVPLKEGGKDDPSNMQQQPKEAAKAKDKVEQHLIDYI